MPEAEKRTAGKAALQEVTSGMMLGLGTGSTVRHFLEGLGDALGEGRLTEVRGVATSLTTERLCRDLGIPTVELDEGVELDLAVDGADEVDPRLDLIKGLGGALLREKMVVQASSRFVVIVDSGKEVASLGSRAPVPVEVVPFGWRAHLPFFRTLGAEPHARLDSAGGLLVTDNGNHIIDLTFPHGIDDPPRLQEILGGRAGVVETGLFLGMADRVIVGSGEGAVVLERDGR